MFVEKFKFLFSILIVLMLGISANVIALNFESGSQNDHGSERTGEELENTNDLNIEVAKAEVELEPGLEPTTKIIKKNLPIKKIDPNEIFSIDPEQIEPSMFDPSNYLKDRDVEPFSLLVDEYPGNTVLTPDEVLRMDSTPPSSENSVGESSRGSSRSRADAGDDQASATELFDGGNWTGDRVETHIGGNPPQYIRDDFDWFKIYVRELGGMKVDYVNIRIENTAPPHATNRRELHCYMWDPLAVILNTTSNWPFNGPLNGKAVSESDDDVHQKFIDAEIIQPGENATLNAAPPITGYFIIVLFGLADINMNYNFTSVSITEVQRDSNNYVENSTKPQQTSVSNQQVEQHLDHWDWYDISAYFDYTGSKWDNKVSYNIDITSEETGPSTDHSWTEVFVVYDSDDGGTLYFNGDERQTGGAPSRAGTDPISHSFITKGSIAFMGIRVWSMGVVQGNYLQHTFNGRAGYDITSFSVEIQNNNPILDQGKRDPAPDFYYLEEMVTFKVRYKDLDNNEPDYVRVTVDGINYEMTSSQSNYQTGAVFTKTLAAIDLGVTPYPHTFNFSATDGQIPITLSLPIPKNQFKIIQNQTPNVFLSAIDKITMDEDDDIKTLLLNQIFEDADTTDGMDFHIKQGASFGKKFESSIMEIFFVENNKLKIQLKEHQYGSNEIVIRAKETLIRNPDTYSFYTNHKINITVNEVNDEPLLDPISNPQGYQGDELRVQISATDPDIFNPIEADIDTLSFSINRTDQSKADYIPGLKMIDDPIDSTKANITLTPGNEQVGKFFLKVMVEDNDDDEDSQNVEFEILNVNDAPVIIKIITDKETQILDPEANYIEFTGKKYGAMEDEWFNMTVEVNDIDNDIGENNEMEFKIENSTFSTAFNIYHAGGTANTALVSILPRDEDVGTNYINLSVHDGKGGSDYVTIEIDTINVNDAPNTPLILKPEDENNTFSIVDTIKFEGQCDDEDFYILNSAEVLTFIWQLEYTDGSDKTVELNRGTTTDSESFSFKMVPTDWHLSNDLYVVKLVVRDVEKIERTAQVSITLSDDYDADLILDRWEKEYGLNPHNRKDARDDLDDDGFTNIEEFEADTNPYDKRDHPSTSEGEGDYGWLTYVAILIVVVVILLILFMFIQKRRHAKVEDDIDKLAYPVEDGFEMEMAQPMGPAPAQTTPAMTGTGAAPGTGAGAPGQMQMPSPQQFMALNPMQRMQLMQQMQMQMMKQQQQQQQQPQQQGSGMQTPGFAGAGAGVGMMPGQGQLSSQPVTGEKLQEGKLVEPTTDPHLEPVGLKPQLPPGRITETDENDLTGLESQPDGRHAPIDALSDEELGDIDIKEQEQLEAGGPELVAGEPDLLSESEISDSGIVEEEPAMDTDSESESIEDTGENDMKCPNCGISVKSGWFLCPACKSPIN
jgi:hypothetical protein